ncbi:MAG: hypothetical protein H6685_01250 [Deltaproteobacteria bacterium]|nr:hypothetical protein [Deltaproteobacteria bacterium]
MKRVIVIGAGVAAIFLLLALATRERDFDPERLNEIALAAVDLHGEACRAKPDLGHIRGLYRQGGVEKMVRLVDSKLDLRFASKYKEGIEIAKGSLAPSVNTQISALTISRAFWEYMQLRKPEKGPEEIERGIAAARAVDETLAINRHLDHPPVTPLDGALREVRTRMHTAAKKAREEGGKGYDALLSETRTALVLSVLVEVYRAEKYAAENPDSAESISAAMHQARALQYFNMIYSDVGKEFRQEVVRVSDDLRERPIQVATLHAVRRDLLTAFRGYTPNIQPEWFEMHYVSGDDPS